MTANNLHSQRHAFVSPTNFQDYVEPIDTSLTLGKSPKGLGSDFLSSPGPLENHLEPPNGP